MRMIRLVTIASAFVTGFPIPVQESAKAIIPAAGIRAGVGSLKEANRSILPQNSTQNSSAGARAPHMDADVVMFRHGSDIKADIYRSTAPGSTHPLLITFHGGGLTHGDKSKNVNLIGPFLDMGYSVINANYRLADEAHAPAAITDARCVLYWAQANAARYGFDMSSVVVEGGSSGGHLALMTVMLQPKDGLDGDCAQLTQQGAATALPAKVAAVISWSGVDDELDSLIGPDARPWAARWIGPRPGGEAEQKEIARKLSPIANVREGLPPILIIHGTDDPVVPYAQAVALHHELDAHHDPNRLLLIPHGKHVEYTPDQWAEAWKAVESFLATYHLPSRAQ